MTIEGEIAVLLSSVAAATLERLCRIRLSLGTIARGNVLVTQRTEDPANERSATGYDQTPSLIQTNARASKPSSRCQGVLPRRLLRRGFRAGPS